MPFPLRHRLSVLLVKRDAETSAARRHLLGKDNDESTTVMRTKFTSDDRRRQVRYWAGFDVLLLRDHTP